MSQAAAHDDSPALAAGANPAAVADALAKSVGKVYHVDAVVVVEAVVAIAAAVVDAAAGLAALAIAAVFAVAVIVCLVTQAYLFEKTGTLRERSLLVLDSRRSSLVPHSLASSSRNISFGKTTLQERVDQAELEALMDAMEEEGLG